MSDKCKGTTNIFSHTGGVVTADILAPTEANQVPVSQQNQVTGAFEYAPQTNPLKNISASDAGKGVRVSQDGETLEPADIVESNQAIEQFLNQTGEVTKPIITIVNTNTIRITSFIANFYDPFDDIRDTVNIPQTDLVISLAGSNGPNDNVTYILVDKLGTFLEATAPPNINQLKEELYLCEVSHPAGGPIEAVRPLTTIFSNILVALKEQSRLIGFVARGFIFSFTRASGLLSQDGLNARIEGYNINASTTDRNVVSFPTGNITFEYFSFNPADAVPSESSFLKTYNIDDPANNTSSSMGGGGNRGILVIFASFSGKYVVFAPQQEFDSFDEANSRRNAYISSLVLPDGFKDLYTPVATVIVEDDVTSNPNTDFELELTGEVSFNGGAFASQRTLPNPASGQPGDLVAVDPTAQSYVLKSDSVPDLSGATDGDFLVAQNGTLTTLPITSNAVTAGLFTGTTGVKIVILEISNGAVVSSVGDTADIVPYLSINSTSISIFNAPGDVIFIGGFAFRNNLEINVGEFGRNLVRIINGQLTSSTPVKVFLSYLVR